MARHLLGLGYIYLTLSEGNLQAGNTWRQRGAARVKQENIKFLKNSRDNPVFPASGESLGCQVQCMLLYIYIYIYISPYTILPER